ncbi:MAG: adenylyltransferase/cytidyltransferase family protein [Candidatus Pacebacteria bacterium]|nr:adenylyltransferase/cytidyltransferase family protein [Candidatus Paceibacterota bacterium]
MKKIKTITQLHKICNDFRKKGKNTVLVTGVFDVLHYEHIGLLCFARKKADALIVGVECDENVRLFKGKKRPIFDFKQRSSVLEAMEPVDFIFKVPKIKKDNSNHPFYPEFYKKVTEQIGPDILATNIAQDSFWEEKKQRAKKLDIKFAAYRKKPKTSSSEAIFRLRAAR